MLSNTSMKRKHSVVISRPTKKQRVDSIELANRLQDEEEDERERLRVLDAQKAVELAYEDERKSIRREFRTLNPERVLPERRLALEQKLEFQDTLRADRLAEIEADTAARASACAQARENRSRTQEIDEKIEECLDIASEAFTNASWQSIGKFRCVSAFLARSDLSTDQKTQYDKVLKKMAENGWRVRKRKSDIKVSCTEKHDAAATAAAAAADVTD